MKNTRTRIKICGLTRPEDALHAVSCGADAIGLVFYSKSSRAVTIEQALAIMNDLPPFVSTVGLFVNADENEVNSVLNQVPLDILQFHGDEDESYCTSFIRPYFKALRVKPEMDIAQAVAQYPKSSGILLDAWHKDIAGGTGKKFDWDLLKDLNMEKPLILAGGLAANNVAEAIIQVRPYAVDVSSGIESAPGIKSKDKIKQFVDEVISV